TRNPRIAPVALFYITLDAAGNRRDSTGWRKNKNPVRGAGRDSFVTAEKLTLNGAGTSLFSPQQSQAEKSGARQSERRGFRYGAAIADSVELEVVVTGITGIGGCSDQDPIHAGRPRTGEIQVNVAVTGGAIDIVVSVQGSAK